MRENGGNGGKKSHGDERILSKKRYTRMLWQQFEYFIESFTPESIRDLRPLNTMYIVSATVLVLYILAFSFFLFYGYQNEYNTLYLVPVSSDLSDASQVCTLETKEVTDLSFYIDKKGLYDGQNGFVYADARYKVQINNIGFTQTSYVSYMAKNRANIDAVGTKAMDSTLNVNILTYLSYKFVLYASSIGNSSDNYLQTFSLVADLGDIFQPTYDPAVFIMSRDRQCLIDREAYFDGPSFTMGLSFNGVQYNSNSNCTNVLNFYAWSGQQGYSDFVRSMNRNVNGRLDMRSFIVAHAINMGFYSDDNCAGNINNCFQESQPPEIINGGFIVHYYIDSSFEGMTPVQCIKSPNTTNEYELFCAVSFQRFTTVPVLEVIRSDTDTRDGCTCDDDNECNTFGFVVSLLMYDVNPSATESERNIDTYYPLQRLGFKYIGNYTGLLKDAYNATLPRYDEFTDQSLSYYDFCYDEPTNQYCRVVTFITLNSNSYMNRFKRQLLNGGCNNTVSITDDAWEQVYNSQPFDFNEKYASCHKTPSMAFFQATALSIANTFSYVPLSASLIAVSYLLYTYFYYKRNENDPLQSESRVKRFKVQDQREILRIFANNLLKELYRRKYDSKDASRKNKITTKLGNAMSNLVDVIEAELSEEYLRNPLYMSSTAESFGYLLDPDIFRGSHVEQEDTHRAMNPMSSISSATASEIANEAIDWNTTQVNKTGASGEIIHVDDKEIEIAKITPAFIVSSKKGAS